MGAPKPSEPLTASQLEKFVCQCDKEGCENNVLFFHSQCHLGAGIEVSYRKDSRALTLRCRECKKFIADVAVADPN